MKAFENPAMGHVTVTLAYWTLMLTDGALRMLVLLHFYTLGYSPLTLAYLFLAYELMGVVTNFLAGWLGSRYGVYALLFSGLLLQIAALLALTQLSSIDGSVQVVVFVMLVQSISGVAKDLTKTGAKSAMKLLSKQSNSGQLFRWVAALTGSKNAIKGLGFFLGAALLAWIGFVSSLLAMIALLLVVVIGVALAPRPSLGHIDAKRKIIEVFSTSRSVNVLSLARLFLFASRDTWFVVALPLYLHAALVAHFSITHSSAFFVVGGFMATWILVYGFVQAFAPTWLASTRDSVASSVQAVQRYTASIAVVLLVLALISVAEDLARVSTFKSTFTIALLVGLFVFGAVFAIGSSLHSFLILAFTSKQRASMDVGFYYMSNAAGRLLGTLLSGLSYQLGGVAGCLVVAASMAALSFIIAKRL